jgi:hypothetical protein
MKRQHLKKIDQKLNSASLMRVSRDMNFLSYLVEMPPPLCTGARITGMLPPNFIGPGSFVGENPFQTRAFSKQEIPQGC